MSSSESDRDASFLAQHVPFFFKVMDTTAQIGFGAIFRAENHGLGPRKSKLGEDCGKRIPALWSPKYQIRTSLIVHTCFSFSGQGPAKMTHKFSEKPQGVYLCRVRLNAKVFTTSVHNSKHRKKKQKKELYKNCKQYF